MTEREFQTNMKAADTFRRLAPEQYDGSSDFWMGYMRGLRRLYHGDAFGIEDEHILWMASADQPDDTHRFRGMGYRAGFAGQSIQRAMQTFSGPHTYTCTRCDHEWRPRNDQPPKHCPSCKSPYWDKPRTKT